MDTSVDVFNILLQFYESSLGYKMSSSHHFNENSYIEDIVFVLEISAKLGLNHLVEDLAQHSLEPNISENN